MAESAALTPKRPRFTFRPFVYWPAVLVAVATILISMVAILWPAIDQFFTAQFYAGAGRFPARDLTAFRVLHFAGYTATQLVIVGLLAFLVAKLSGSRLVEAISWRAWWFLTLGLAIGPGLIVNGLLKPLMNRPRPVQTDLFGGHQTFVAAWSTGQAEIGNHSFASGEAAAAIYLVAFAFVAPKPWRRSLAALALLWAFAISLNRIAFGAHYLSDVLVAWGLTLIVILQLRVLLLPDHDHQSRSATGSAPVHPGRV